eukprot:15114972-Heterocapsa_arctica.AAC.1
MPKVTSPCPVEVYHAPTRLPSKTSTSSPYCHSSTADPLRVSDPHLMPQLRQLGCPPGEVCVEMLLGEALGRCERVVEVEAAHTVAPVRLGVD